MTDKELRDAAIVHLKKTTVGYINKHWTTPPVGSEWEQGLTLLAQMFATQPPPPPTGNYLYRIDVTNNGFAGLDMETSSTSSTAGITYGSLSAIVDPETSSRKAIKYSVPGTSPGNRQATEILKPITPVLGRHRFVGFGLNLLAEWRTIYGNENEQTGDWGCLVIQLHYAGIHGCPIGLAVHKDRIAVALMTGNSPGFGSNSEFQTNQVSGGDGSPAAYPSCLGRQVGRPGELVNQPMTLGVNHYFAVEIVEAWDFTGKIAIWHKVTGNTWTKTWEMNNIPTHQYTSTWNAFGRNDKFCLYTPNSIAQSLLHRDGICSTDTIVDLEASLGI